MSISKESINIFRSFPHGNKDKLLRLNEIKRELNNDSKPYISVNENIIDNYIIANKELEEKKLPFIIQRPIPNNTFEYWKLEDLEII